MYIYEVVATIFSRKKKKKKIKTYKWETLSFLSLCRSFEENFMITLLQNLMVTTFHVLMNIKNNKMGPNFPNPQTHKKKKKSNHCISSSSSSS